MTKNEVKAFFDKFIALFKNFTPQEKIKVMHNVKDNLIEQGKIEESFDVLEQLDYEKIKVLNKNNIN